MKQGCIVLCFVVVAILVANCAAQGLGLGASGIQILVSTYSDSECTQLSVIPSYVYSDNCYYASVFEKSFYAAASSPTAMDISANFCTSNECSDCETTLTVAQGQCTVYSVPGFTAYFTATTQSIYSSTTLSLFSTGTCTGTPQTVSSAENVCAQMPSSFSGYSSYFAASILGSGAVGLAYDCTAGCSTSGSTSCTEFISTTLGSCVLLNNGQSASITAYVPTTAPTKTLHSSASVTPLSTFAIFTACVGVVFWALR